MRNQYMSKIQCHLRKPRMKRNADSRPLESHFNRPKHLCHRVTLAWTVWTLTLEDPIEDLPSVFHTTYFTGASTSLLHGKHAWFLIENQKPCMLTPSRFNEGMTTVDSNHHPLSWQAPGLIPPFQWQNSSGCIHVTRRSKVRDPNHPKRPRDNEQKTHKDESCPSKLHICITIWE